MTWNVSTRIANFLRFSGETMRFLQVNTAGKANFVRISALKWADLLAAFAMYMMMNYLTNVWNLNITHAAGIVNIWNGSTPILAFVFAFFVDIFVGHFYMLMFSSIAYSIGLGLLSMSTPVVFGPCHHYKVECVGHTQKVLFYNALCLIAVGKAGQVVSLPPFWELDPEKTENENVKKHGAKTIRKKKTEKDLEKTENENVKKHEAKTTKKKKTEKDLETNQNENVKKHGAKTTKKKKTEKDLEKTKNENVKKHAKNIKKKKIFYYTIAVVVLILGGIVLPYIKPWSIRFGVPAICYVVATLLFFTGIQDYKHKEPTGSPLITTMRVFVAAARKISQPIPCPKDLYNEDDVRSTNSLRCFDKAAITLPAEQQPNRWNLCSVREVEDTKSTIRMVPMWLTFIVIGIVRSTGTTYFLEQADRMDPKLGKIKVSIPIFLLFYVATRIILEWFYTTWEKCLPKKKHAPPLGIATSMVFSVLCCITAAKVETQRLHRIRDHGLLDKPNEVIPMSIFALLPQFMLLAAVTGIANKSISGFFRDQTPESLHKYLKYFTNGVLGLGRMASVLLVYIVGKVSERNQKPNWFQNTLNRSRLDRYYWVLAGLSTVNLVGYVIVAYFYKYKESSETSDDEIEDEIEEEI